MSKSKNRVVLAIFVLFLVPCCSGSWFDFMWSKKSEEHVSTELRKLPSVLYELPEQDQEFLKEALKITEVDDSELDRCQHRIIIKLKHDCHKLDSESLGKLAVMMMNCQFVAEGRSSRMFPCTPSMSLKQCTIGMDSQVYQLYQTMSSRVQAVCISKRQEQFRGLAELTVNKLMQNTIDQYSQAQELLAGQIRLNEMTQDNIKEIDENDVKIKSAQIQTLELTKKSNIMLEGGIQELQKEQQIITQIQNQLSDHQNTLIQSTDTISESLKETIENLQENNEKMMKNLEETKKQLDEINGMVQYFLEVIRVLKGLCDNFMTFIRELGVDVEAENFNVIAVNFIYMLLGMIILNFLGASATFKYIFVCVIGLNIFAHIMDRGMPILVVNNLFMTSWVVTSFVTWFMKFFTAIKNFIHKKKVDQEDDTDTEELEEFERRRSPSRQPSAVAAAPLSANESAEVNDLTRIAEQEMSDIFNNTNQMNTSTSSGIITVRTPNQINADRPATPYTRPLTPALRRVMSESVSNEELRAGAGTPFIQGMVGRIPCQGITQKGQPCKNAAAIGFSYCRVHNK